MIYTTHTPGPWAFRDCTLVQDTGNRLHLGVFRESPGLGSAAAGNARLIAAAPDLLAALKDITERYERLLVDSRITKRDAEAMREMLPYYTEQARAAIAKAEEQT